MKHRNIIVCDLDGTLADCEHRVHHVQRVDGDGLKRKPDWDAFYAEIKYDKIHNPVAQVLDRFIDYERTYYDIIFCSGRPERCRVDTVEWLTWAGIAPDTYTLLMRKDGDFRADYIVKQEILDNHIDKDRVLFVMDDRQQVVDMWRRNGLVCFQVAPGNF
jgi:hypothetical protein